MGSLYCGTNYFDVDQWLLCFVRFKFVDVAHGFDPLITLPKTVCLLSSQGVATTVMKN